MTDDVQVPDGDRGVEGVILAHLQYGNDDDPTHCGCGLVEPDGVYDANDAHVSAGWHAAHLAERLRAALTSQPAPTESMVERLEAVHDSFGEDVSEDFCDGYLRAALEVEVNGKYHGFAQPAPTVTDEAEKAWDEGHRRGYSDGYDDNGNGYEHDPDVAYTPQGNPYRKARTTTEEADHG